MQDTVWKETVMGIRGAIAYHYQKYVENKMKNEKSRQAVLMFHRITEVETDDEFSISRKNLLNICDEYRLIIKPLPISEVDEPSLYITFDDISDTVYSIKEELDNRDIPYTIFVATALIGTEDHISEAMLSDFALDKNCTIGSHTVSHSRLIDCSSEKLEEEFRSSRDILRLKTGRNIELVAYPYGSLDSLSRKVIQVARNSGYRQAYSTLQCSVADVGRDDFLIPRWNVNDRSCKMVMGEIERLKSNEC